MAHDPTLSWPTGKGPDDTIVTGAAWLELLDGQAFPIVGAGVMVRDGNLWIPASSSNPLHTRDAALASLIGALNAAKETNPDAASASILALLRGMLATFGKETTLAAVKAAAESLAQEDFATETTLAALLSAVGNLATEATLSDVKSAVDTLAGTVADGAQKVTLSGSTVDMATETTLAQSVDKLNSILSRLESKFDTAIFDSQGNPISAANRLPVEAALSGSIVSPGSTLLNNAGSSQLSPWLVCKGQNRALVRLSFSADFEGNISCLGRADTVIVTVPMYLYNTGVAVLRTSVTGYYEIDVNPLNEIAFAAEVVGGTVTCTVWTSATTFVPDTAAARITMFANIAIRDTNVHRSPVIEGFNQTRGALVVYNSLGQPVRLRAADRNGIPFKDADGNFVEITVPHDSSFSRIYGPEHWPIVLGGPTRLERFTVQCDVAPTAGVLVVTYMINP